MLWLEIPNGEVFDESSQTFIQVKGTNLQLEHSLVSISKWESKWCKPFIRKEKMTPKETMDYVKCMTITQNVDPYTYYIIPKKCYEEIDKYINSKMTATYVHSRQGGPPSREPLTSEIIYYKMIAYGIPFECQKWHLNRLLTLIQVCQVKSQKPQKIGAKETLQTQRAINEARRRQYNTKG